MLNKTEFLTIFCTYSNLEIVKQTLPSVIKETNRDGNAKLIIHDSTQKQHGQKEKWAWLREIELEEENVFLILSTNMSMAHARNMCLHLGQELYAPEYVAMMEDDHGYHPNLIPKLVAGMKKYYGLQHENGMRFGLFGCCKKHFENTAEIDYIDKDKNITTLINRKTTLQSFRINSCFRCAPTSHWNNVLKGYDTDEYLISFYQTMNLNLRNYNKGFTTFVLEDGKYMFDVEGPGRGVTDGSKLRLWDENYAASDPRSKYLGKTTKNIFQKLFNKS